MALAVGGVALQLLQVGERAVERRAGLLDLAVDRAALRRLATEQREAAAPDEDLAVPKSSLSATHRLWQP